MSNVIRSKYIQKHKHFLKCRILNSCSDYCNLQGERGHYAHAHAHAHAHGHAHGHAGTLQNPEALVPEIEEGAVNRRLLQALFLLPWGGARTATGPGAIYPQIKCNVRGVS